VVALENVLRQFMTLELAEIVSDLITFFTTVRRYLMVAGTWRFLEGLEEINF
jgi:hypothetical protein